ncbi:MAG: heat-inducible transcriptional repressor HrcA, partial [Bifidobacteriaceae bacterium]|nr:heat-inducible transcriptional repressor HrcA [Bifidobacteriaceae bacterium]
EVLRAIVEDYVQTQEPVGSRMLTQRHKLGVSPATIRNDMAQLEDEGYITQPHTSAGRIPTDAGYRVFVDHLAQVKPLSPAERRAIQALLLGADDLDEIVDRTVHALARLTHQVAVVQYPSLSHSRLRHVEFVQLTPNRVLAVLITSQGRVEQRVVTVPAGLDPSHLGRFAGRVNEVADGRLPGEFRDKLKAVPLEFPEPDRPALGALVTAVQDTLEADKEERVALAGASNLAGNQDDFQGSLGPVLEALEEQVVMLKLLAEMASDTGEVQVRIGNEVHHQGLHGASLVSTSYSDGQDVVGRLGVLGPTRMDYPGSIAAVRAIARYLSRILST